MHFRDGENKLYKEFNRESRLLCERALHLSLMRQNQSICLYGNSEMPVIL